ncbi:MAG: glutathione S-transferase C-terminal domain-containing protein [Pseudomonadota bacterium]
MAASEGPSKPLLIHGAPGSPYTRKLLALLRYRRIPHGTVWTGVDGAPADLPKPKVALLPTVYRRDTEGRWRAEVDTTPIARRLEAAHSARRAEPEDPTARLLNALIEDFADEWVTKAMFHYRWAHAADAAHAAPLLVHWAAPSLASAEATALADSLKRRQIERLYVVGSNAVTAETIEASYLRLLTILDRLIEQRAFLFGDRPATADFALYGQLTQLVTVDPTPSRLAAERAPRVRAWLDRVDDLSGLGSQLAWDPPEVAAGRLRPLLAEIGRVYAPFLIANAAAVEADADAMRTQIDGRPWEQPPFPYQAKCLNVLREDFRAAPAAARERILALLEGSGCAALFLP